MILGIEASNIRGGGGVTHLVELLKAAEPGKYQFSLVIVWGGKRTLARIEERPWLVKSHQPILDKSLPYRVFWQSFRLPGLIKNAGCNTLFVPGGSYFGNFHPTITFSQNLLPFEWNELKRFGISWVSLRLLILKMIQSSSFKRADGLIFLTKFARNIVMQKIKSTAGMTVIIPHGIDKRFISQPREQSAISFYSFEKPIRIVYISIVDMYKHQWNVAAAVALLRRKGIPLQLDLIGPAYGPALKKLEKVLNKIDPEREFVKYRGAVPYEELHVQYFNANIAVFASSCETFGQILTEAMSMGLPIACSDRSAMPELLRNAGVYFNPEDIDDIARALSELIDSPVLRSKLSKASFELASSYSWERCAKETFDFLSQVTRATPAK